MNIAEFLNFQPFSADLVVEVVENFVEYRRSELLQQWKRKFSTVGDIVENPIWFT